MGEDLRPRVDGRRAVKNWHDYLSENHGFDACALRSPDAENIKVCQGFALTALQALQQLPPTVPLLATNDGRCVVWVLGARDHVEKQQILAGGWSPLFSAVDVQWDVLLIGPEISPDPIVRSKDRVRLMCLRSVLHEAWVPKSVSSPTFVLAFNTGIGSSLPHLMLPWLPTLGNLLQIRCPVLLTCFGPQEALIEVWMLKALHAHFWPHKKAGFGTMQCGGADRDKPVGMSNSMFSWVRGSSLPPPQLLSHAVPHVRAQLEGIEFLDFLKHASTFLEILADPRKKAVPCWVQIHRGLLLHSVRNAIDVHTVLRCVIGSMSSACRCRAAAAVAVDLGAERVVDKFTAWCASDAQSAEHEMCADMLEELLDIKESLAKAPPLHLVGDVEGVHGAVCDEEHGPIRTEPLGATFQVQAPQVQLMDRPSLQARVVATIVGGDELRITARSGIWLQAENLRQQQHFGAVHDVRPKVCGWFLAYRRRRSPVVAAIVGVEPGGSCVGVVSGWEASDWDVLANFIFF